jgi:hypothetical protein
MVKRESVPPMRPRDVVINGGAEAASAPLTAEHIKTSYYLRPDQMDLLDARRAELRRAGVRSVNASMLMRTALDLAARHVDEWTELVEEAAG